MRVMLQIRLATSASVLAMAVAGFMTTSAGAQTSGVPTVGGLDISNYAPRTIIDPPSSLPLAKDVGKRAHTNVKILVVPSNDGAPIAPPRPGGVSPALPPTSGYYYETPASLACAYGLVAFSPGCPPNTLTANSTKGSRAIAIVDAYDDPTAFKDLATFSSQFSLPAPSTASFQVVFASGSRPPNGNATGWDIEESLDVQWAHGMAPHAQIFLVEAASNSYTDLFTAVDKASALVAAAGGGEVSMSWGGPEFSSETGFDSNMKTANVVYFAASGDHPGTEYPCVSPYVVCVGGTGNARPKGQFDGSVTWESTGGGISAFEARPSYQNGISGIVGANRGGPDVGAIADPNSGVWVVDSNNSTDTTYWHIVGGTSVATPVTAAIVNAAGHFYASTAIEQAQIYATLGTEGGGWDYVTFGFCGPYDGTFAVPGWDACTGAGTPNGLSAK